MTELSKDFYLQTNIPLGPEAQSLMYSTWPRYLSEPSDIPDPSLRCTIHPQEMAKRSRTWTIRRKSDDRLVACCYGLLIRVGGELPVLPKEGWRFAVASAISQNFDPDALCLVAVNVDKEFRGIGLAEWCIQAAKESTHELGFRWIVVPLRPSLKFRFPNLSFDEYVAKQNEKGEPFDPWLRTHLKAGASVVNICSESVLQTASLAKWREWTGLEFSQSGKYELEYGIGSLDVDVESNTGTYCEPNLWIRYRL